MSRESKRVVETTSNNDGGASSVDIKSQDRQIPMQDSQVEVQIYDEVVEREIELMGRGKLGGFVFRPSNVKEVLKAPRMKEQLVSFFQELYKPKS